MIPDLHTEFQVNELRRQESLAARARFRAAQGDTAHDGTRHGPGALRRWVGAALVQVGQRLQGARPVEPVGGSAGNLVILGNGR